MGKRRTKQRYTRLTSKSGEWRVDPRLRALIVADADAEGSSMTSVVTRILSEAFNVPFEPTSRPGRPTVDQDVIVLRLPIELDRKIGMKAAANDRKVQDEILVALSAHYGLPMPADAVAA